MNSTEQLLYAKLAMSTPNPLCSWYSQQLVQFDNFELIFCPKCFCRRVHDNTRYNDTFLDMQCEQCLWKIRKKCLVKKVEKKANRKDLLKAFMTKM